MYKGFFINLMTLSIITDSAGSDYIKSSRVLIFTGDSVQTVSIQIIDDSISEPSETFFGLLSSADGILIPSNVRLTPNRTTATIIDENGMIGVIMLSPCN